jgi:mgtE-like transporter
VAWLDATVIFLFAAFMFSLRGIAAELIARLLGLASPGAVTMVGVSVAAGMIATVLAVVIAYYVAVATYRLGMDPDNHGIPIVSSTMDLLGMIAFVIALLAFGVAS